jgi:hypothetical protein
MVTTTIRRVKTAVTYSQLCYFHAEQEEDCEIPKERRLTPDLCREFVLILRPVVFLSMFGKDQYTVGASQTTIKYLACKIRKL